MRHCGGKGDRAIVKNRIYITNEQNAVEVTMKLRGLIRRAVNAALKYEKFENEAEVSVTVTDNEGIRELNSRYRNIDRPTDVLSFPIFDEAEEDEASILGDIVISAEKAVSQAEEYGHSLEREIAFLCVHSVLHLLGYDHETSEEDEREMFAKQEDILRLMKLER